MKTIINNITFYNKKAVIEYSKRIMERNIDKILTGEDLKFMWELVILHYPQPKVKNLHCADKLIIRLSPHTKSTWLWVIDNNGREHDVSIHKAIDNLKWEENESDDNVLTFGKYIHQKVEDVIGDDKDYFLWLVSQTWIKEPLRKIIYRELNIIDNEELRKREGILEKSSSNGLKKIETTIENLEKYMNPDSPDFPIMYNGRLYEKRDCDKDFLAFYEGKFMLNGEGGIYMSDGMYMFPDGSWSEGL